MNNNFNRNGKSNYIKDYKGFDSTPDVHMQNKKGVGQEADFPSALKNDSAKYAGLSAAEKFALEQKRSEERKRAIAAAQRAGVPVNQNRNMNVQSTANAPRRTATSGTSLQRSDGTRGQVASYRNPQTVANGGSTTASAASRLPQITVNATVVLAVIAVLLVVFTFVAFGRLKQGTIPVVEKESVMGDITAQMAPILKEGYVTKPIGSANVYAGNLMLVNSDVPFVFNNTPDVVPAEELVTINYVKNTKSYKVKDNTVMLNSTAVTALGVMFDAFFAEKSIRDVMISAGYRSSENQQAIYDKKVEELGAEQKTAQLPGFSEHHTGYAVDFNIYTDRGITHQFNGDGDYAWIPENAHKYGFILRYPEGKTEITGIDYEPWHYRYVGNPHANYLVTNGKTLEEYITLLKNYPCDYPLYITDFDGAMYTVYYKKSDGATTDLPVPATGEYSISGNNVDGFIVTVKS